MNNNSMSIGAAEFFPLAQAAQIFGCSEAELLRSAVLDGFPLFVPYEDEIVEWGGKATGRKFSVYCLLSDYIIRQLLSKTEVSFRTDMLLGCTPSPNKKFKDLADALLCFVPDTRGSGHYELTTKVEELVIVRGSVGVMARDIEWIRAFFTAASSSKIGQPSSLNGEKSSAEDKPIDFRSWRPIHAKAPPPIKPVDTSKAPDLSYNFKFEKPDWSRWKTIDNTRLWKAACLVADIEPPKDETKDLWYEAQLRNFPARFHRVWEAVNWDNDLSQLDFADYSGRMLHVTSIAKFAVWAIKKGLDVPVPLQEIAARSVLTQSPDSGERVDPDTSPEEDVGPSQEVKGPQTKFLVTEDELRSAFNCRSDLFRDGHKFLWFKEARKPGRGGRNPIKPTYDPFAFAVNLPGSTYAPSLTESQAWKILKVKFPDRYLDVESYDPNK